LLACPKTVFEMPLVNVSAFAELGRGPDIFDFEEVRDG
jgi:hypothetical protein